MTSRHQGHHPTSLSQDWVIGAPNASFQMETVSEAPSPESVAKNDQQFIRCCLVWRAVYCCLVSCVCWVKCCLAWSEDLINYLTVLVFVLNEHLECPKTTPKTRKVPAENVQEQQVCQLFRQPFTIVYMYAMSHGCAVPVKPLHGEASEIQKAQRVKQN